MPVALLRPDLGISVLGVLARRVIAVIFNRKQSTDEDIRRDRQ